MTLSIRGYHCPRCTEAIPVPASRIDELTCLHCRTVVVLVNEDYGFHASLDGVEAPLRCCIQQVVG